MRTTIQELESVWFTLVLQMPASFQVGMGVTPVEFGYRVVHLVTICWVWDGRPLENPARHHGIRSRYAGTTVLIILFEPQLVCPNCTRLFTFYRDWVLR